MTTTFIKIHGLTFALYLRWGLYSVGPPPVFWSSPAVPSSWRRTAASARSVTPRTSRQYIQQHWLQHEYRCEVYTGCVWVTSRCCFAPCSSHSCLCLITCRHSSLYTPADGDTDRMFTTHHILDLSNFWIKTDTECGVDFLLDSPFWCELWFKHSQLKDLQLPNTTFHVEHSQRNFRNNAVRLCYRCRKKTL